MSRVMSENQHSAQGSSFGWSAPFTVVDSAPIERVASPIDTTEPPPSVEIPGHISAFVKFVITKTESDRQRAIIKWFHRDSDVDGDLPSPRSEKSENERVIGRFRDTWRRPLELQRESVLERANEFYDKTEWSLSTFFVAVLTLLFFIPAAIIYIPLHFVSWVTSDSEGQGSNRGDTRVFQQQRTKTTFGYWKGSFHCARRQALYVVFELLHVNLASTRHDQFIVSMMVRLLMFPFSIWRYQRPAASNAIPHLL